MMEDRKNESFFFLLLFFCKVYQNALSRMRKIQETIVQNNNYNIKVRGERPPPSFPPSTPPPPPLSMDPPLDTDDTTSTTSTSTTDNINNNHISLPPPPNNESNFSHEIVEYRERAHSVDTSSSSGSPDFPSSPRLTPLPNTHDGTGSNLIKHFQYVFLFFSFHFTSFFKYSHLFVFVCFGVLRGFEKIGDIR